MCFAFYLSLYFRNVSAFYHLWEMSQTVCSHPPRHFLLLTVLSLFLFWPMSLIVILIRDLFDPEAHAHE